MIRWVELLEVHLPLAAPFRASTGDRSERRILLLRVEADGRVGWSECVALEDPGYTGETTDTAWHVLTRYLLPEVPGLDVDPPAGILEPLSWVRDHPMAKAAVEMAAWDLSARLRGISLSERLGGGGGEIPVGVSVGFHDTTEELLQTVEAHLERGYHRVKVKIGPGRDVGPLGAIREHLGSDVDLLADANGAYGPGDIPHLRELDAFELVLLEQPFPPADLLSHARLREALRTPVCLDESLESLSDVETALALGACDVVNLKPGRVGGLAEARRIHDLCRDRGIPLWCGGMLESGVGRAHNLALASLPGFTLPGDLSESARYWKRDLIDPPFVLEGGCLRVPDGPGIGVAPDEAWIRERTVRSARFP